MTKINQNLQYAEWVQSFPNWNGSPSGAYAEWKDVPADKTVFMANTKFRAKPVIAYRVTANSYNNQFADKNAAMSAVAALVSVGKSATIDTFQEPYKCSELAPKLQWRTSASSWLDVTDISKVKSAGAIEFRIRPDFYYEVDVKTAHSTFSSQVFHDKVQLTEYVNRLMASEETTFTVKTVRYV